MARKQKKISRQELREDPLMKTLAQSQSWLEIHGKKLAIVVGAVVVVAAIAFAVISSRQATEHESRLALAQVSAKAAELDSLQLKNELQKVVEDYSGTSGAAEAMYNLGQIALNNGNNEEAVRIFEEFSRKYRDEFMLSISALSARATALENLERYEEAARLHDQVSTKKQASYVWARALVDAGRCYMLAGDTATARDRLEQVEQEYAQSPAASDASLLLAQMNGEG